MSMPRSRNLARLFDRWTDDSVMSIIMSRNVAICEPTCLPGAGYFILIIRADVFVVIEKVRSEHQVKCISARYQIWCGGCHWSVVLQIRVLSRVQ